MPLTFHVQRPPTLRLQPGPSAFTVRPHRDAEYGHQPGELNFWVPLTDAVCHTGLKLSRSQAGLLLTRFEPRLGQARTRTTLWAETEPGAADYQPFEATNPNPNPNPDPDPDPDPDH